MPSGTLYSKLHFFSKKRLVEDEDTELVQTADHSSAQSDQGLHDLNGNRLGQRAWTFYLTVLLDGLMTIVPLSFIVLGILAASLNGKATSSLGESVGKVILLAPTLFPIIFAALVGKFFKLFALYKAESGVKLQTLEQLMGCQSLFSALERQVLLRRTNLMGLGITILWALSPLGGQSALRLVAKIPRLTSDVVDIRYLPLEISQSTYMAGTDLISEGWPSYAPIYMAALMTTQNQDSSAIDLWGNVKIPTIASLSTVDGTYYEVDHTKPIEYSSLLGMPIAMLPDTGNSSFDVVTQYWEIHCYNLVQLRNYTAPWNTTRSSFQMSLGGAGTNTTQDFDFTSLSQSLVPKSVSVANCTLSLRNVVPSISCVGQTCYVDKMRLDETPLNEDLRDQVLTISRTLNSLPWATIGDISHQAQGSIEGSTTTEKWILNPKTNYSDVFTLVDLSSLPLETFSSRLGLVYNTFWQSTFASPFRLGNLSTESSDYDDISILNENYSFNHTATVVRRFDGEQYSCRWIYVIILWIVSGLLFAIACITIILRNKILAPDVLGCASTMLRDNTYAGRIGRIPSHIDGVEATRRLVDARVMLGDVANEEVVGHIAFANSAENPRPLRKGRIYL